jgi:small subunit ribosomal protein S4
MARKIDPKCAECRRAGEKLFLKGEKCLGPKCPILKRNFPPGQHGPNHKHPKLSSYGKQLKEKQTVKRIYGILERQFANYVAAASAKTGDTSKILVQYLESRLDNVVYRMGLAKSRKAARQLVNHGHVVVNGKKVDIASYRVRVGDVVAAKEAHKGKKIFEGTSERLVKTEAPGWMSIDPEKMSVKILNAPLLENPSFNAKAIIEFYSR